MQRPLVELFGMKKEEIRASVPTFSSSPHPPPAPQSLLPLSLLLLLCRILRIRLRALCIRLRHKAPIPTLFFSVTEPQSQHSHHRHFLLRHLNRRCLRRFSSSSVTPSASASAMSIFSSSLRISSEIVHSLSTTVVAASVIDTLPLFTFSSITRYSSSAAADCAICLSLLFIVCSLQKRWQIWGW
ncbi:uncharacterized protein HKW66_Vig0117230 [Vigna angularis]|uniref:Uncharacterized protein n=1 Tax=Phaseolus angularis TaxID=3914 RepID=A0A8T0JVD9_PHAAN|nr:uncharacterized protein HKW66_Vig0117230 [Vigna angularis]